MTNYKTSENLHDHCVSIMNVESQIAGRYEALRFQVTNVIVLASGALVAYSTSGSGDCGLKTEIPIFLIVIAVVGFLMVKRLNHAHDTHYMHYLKARQILYRSHDKLEEKGKEIRKAYDRKTASFKWLDYDRTWEWVVLFVPLIAALTAIH